MSEKSELINKLKKNKETRRDYLRAKLNIIIPSQIRALRLRAPMKQDELAQEADMLQPRISAMERPGATKFNLETLIRVAAALKVGLVVKFVSFSEMLRWQNDFSQDAFNVVTLDDDIEFQREDEEQPIAAVNEPTGLNAREIVRSQQGLTRSLLGLSNESEDVTRILPPPRVATGQQENTPFDELGGPKQRGVQGVITPQPSPLV
jgi:transcriptional regulator with XRE-family HTH domain